VAWLPQPPERQVHRQPCEQAPHHNGDRPVQRGPGREVERVGQVEMLQAPHFAADRVPGIHGRPVDLRPGHGRQNAQPVPAPRRSLPWRKSISTSRDWAVVSWLAGGLRAAEREHERGPTVAPPYQHWPEHAPRSGRTGRPAQAWATGVVHDRARPRIRPARARAPGRHEHGPPWRSRTSPGHGHGPRSSPAAARAAAPARARAKIEPGCGSGQREHGPSQPYRSAKHEALATAAQLHQHELGPRSSTPARARARPRSSVPPHRPASTSTAAWPTPARARAPALDCGAVG